MRKAFYIVIALLAVAGTAAAQERTSGQANDAQVNWSTLSDQFNQVDTQNKALATTVEAIINCNKVGQAWNGTACVDPAAIASITNCGNSGKSWNGSSCVDPYQLGNVKTCANSGKVWNGSYCADPYQLGNITSCAWQGKVWNGSYCQNPMPPTLSYYSADTNSTAASSYRQVNKNIGSHDYCGLTGFFYGGGQNSFMQEFCNVTQSGGNWYLLATVSGSAGSLAVTCNAICMDW